jgi:hypothetical protein
MANSTDRGDGGSSQDRAAQLLSDLLQDAKQAVKKERAGAQAPTDPRRDESRRNDKQQALQTAEPHPGATARAPGWREDSGSAPWPKPVMADSFLMAFGPQTQKRKMWVGVGAVAGLIIGAGATALFSPAMGAPAGEIVLPDINHRAAEVVDQAKERWNADQADARVQAAEKKATDAETQLKVEAQLRAAAEKARTDLEAELITAKAALAARAMAPQVLPTPAATTPPPPEEIPSLKPRNGNGGRKNGGGLDTSVFGK